MILTADLGNSQCTFQVFDGHTSRLKFRISADRHRTEDETLLLVEGILSRAGIRRELLHGSVLCSVVPPLQSCVSAVLYRLIGAFPVEVGPGVRTGLAIRAESQAQVGADIVAGLVGAERRLGAPVILLDLGTATTVTALNSKKEFFGAAILPGLRLGADALSEAAALLPEISLSSPKEPLCKNTKDAFCAGTVLSHAYLLDGYIDAVSERYFDGNQPPVALTGGLADTVAPYLRHTVHRMPDLVSEGLLSIYEKSRT